MKKNLISILCGGKGTRLQGAIGHGCKAAAIFGGVPWLTTAIEHLKNVNSADLLVNINVEHADLISQINIEKADYLYVERERNGFARVVSEIYAMHPQYQNYIFMLGDILFGVEFVQHMNRAIDLINSHNIVTLVRSPRKNLYDYDVVDLDSVPQQVKRASSAGGMQIGGCLMVDSSVILKNLLLLEGNAMSFSDLHNIFINTGSVVVPYLVPVKFEDFGTPERFIESQ